MSEFLWPTLTLKILKHLRHTGRLGISKISENGFKVGHNRFRFEKKLHAILKGYSMQEYTNAGTRPLHVPSNLNKKYRTFSVYAIPRIYILMLYPAFEEKHRWIFAYIVSGLKLKQNKER